jgi:hypothetical protein
MKGAVVSHTLAKELITDLRAVHSPFEKLNYDLDYPQLWYREHGEWTEYPHEEGDIYLLIRAFGNFWATSHFVSPLEGVVVMTTGWGAPLPQDWEENDETPPPSQSPDRQRIGLYYGAGRGGSLSSVICFESGQVLDEGNGTGSLFHAMEWLGFSLYKREWAQGVFDNFQAELKAAQAAGADDLDGENGYLTRWYSERVRCLLEMTGNAPEAETPFL